FRRNGVRLAVTVDEPARVDGELLARVSPSGRTGFASAVGELSLGTARLGLGTGTRTLVLKPARKLAKRVRNRRLRPVVRLTVSDAAGNAVVVTRRVRVT
ncbi:MAG: hypothetical protein HZB46_14500, partial [Solirubrobacterales bacterium]|nr:hypothetical protein [Solirubrobacterales bacterium]